MGGRTSNRGNGLAWAAALILVVVAAVVAVIALNDQTSGGSKPRLASTFHRNQSQSQPHKKAAKSLLVRNATPQPNWKKYTGPVPILVYHALGPVPAGAAFPGLYVSYGDFKAEMAWLNSHGFQAVTLDEVMKAWYHGGALPAKPIVITFDNGYPEQVRFAPHVMSRYGWPGVLNEITENHLPPS